MSKPKDPVDSDARFARKLGMYGIVNPGYDRIRMYEIAARLKQQQAEIERLHEFVKLVAMLFVENANAAATFLTGMEGSQGDDFMLALKAALKPFVVIIPTVEVEFDAPGGQMPHGEADYEVREVKDDRECEPTVPAVPPNEASDGVRQPDLEPGPEDQET